MASGGYPGSYETGHPITGLDAAETPDCKVFHAGTQLDDGAVLTSGGRVLCVTGLGGDVTEACGKAYQGAVRISWQDARYRSDIGYRALAREAGG